MTAEQARVLIVDDEPLNVEIIVEYLEDRPYRLDTVFLVNKGPRDPSKSVRDPDKS